MRICRYVSDGKPKTAFYNEAFVVPLDLAATLYAEATGRSPTGLSSESSLLGGDEALAGVTVEDCLFPHGRAHTVARELDGWIESHEAEAGDRSLEQGLSTTDVQLLAPIARPPKLFLLAGNYAAHIEEGGGVAVLRKETFPYVFMKPLTTINHPGAAVKIPNVSPQHIDWECELGVVMGRKAKGIAESEALDYVAGYMVINDISDRKFRPNPERKVRDKDRFFDWLHGKWHDGFCVMGPCVTSADAIPDPQVLPLQLKVNGEIKQEANTAQQIFPVAAVIEFISSFVTLEPGDVISTGTASGVGSAAGTYLRAGDQVEAAVGGIGVLRHAMADDS